jgi:hypothetical protein
MLKTYLKVTYSFIFIKYILKAKKFKIIDKLEYCITLNNFGNEHSDFKRQQEFH